MKKIILSLIAFGFFAYPIFAEKFLLRWLKSTGSEFGEKWTDQVGELIFFL